VSGWGTWASFPSFGDEWKADECFESVQLGEVLRLGHVYYANEIAKQLIKFYVAQIDAGYAAMLF